MKLVAKEAGPAPAERARRGHERAWEAQRLGNDDARAAGRDRRVQQRRFALLPQRRKFRQSVPALDREEHRRPDDGAGHHRRRDRSFRRLGHGARRPASWPGRSTQGAPMPLAILIALAAGVLAGLNNAFWIAYVGLPSLAVTLAGLIGYRGVARILLEDRAIGGFPDWFNTLGQQALIGPLTAAISIFFVLFIVFAIVLHGSAFGRLVYVVGSNVRGGALFRRAGRIGQGELVRRLGFCRGARRNPLCCATGIGARRHGGGLRTRHHHRRASGRGQHFRRQGQSGRGRPCAARDLEPSQRNGSCRHHRQHPELRDRGASHPLGVGPEYVARPDATNGEGEKHEETS